MQARKFKQDGRAFWSANPCGSASTWEMAQELRFKYTDAYLLPLLEGDLLKERRVLEIGCGQGLDAERIVQRCAEYTGVDLSPASVDSARAAVDARKPLPIASYRESVRRDTSKAAVGFEPTTGKAQRICNPPP